MDINIDQSDNSSVTSSYDSSDSDESLEYEDILNINMEMFSKSISCLPIPMLALVSSYMTVDIEEIVSGTIDDTKRNIRWKESIRSCFDKYLCQNFFLFRFMLRNDHSKNVVGYRVNYDLSICDSDCYYITRDLLTLSLKKMSLDSLNGNMMFHRYNISLATLMTHGHSPDTDKTNISLYEQDNLNNNSKDIIFIDRLKTIDTYFDKSYIFLAGCVNVLATFIGIMQNMKYVSPDADNEMEQNKSSFDKDEFPSHDNADNKNNKEYHDLDLNNVKDDIISSYFSRQDVSLLSVNKSGKGYDVEVETRKISKNVGIWGNDDIYLNFLGSIRKSRLFTGYDNFKDEINLKEQGDYGGYLNPNISDSSVSFNNKNLNERNQQQQQHSCHPTPSPVHTPVLRQSIKEKRRNANSSNDNSRDEVYPVGVPQTHVKLEETDRIREVGDKKQKQQRGDTKKNIDYMKEERRVYCESIQSAISEVFDEISNYVNNCESTYKSSVRSYNNLRNSAREIFRQNYINSINNNNNSTSTNTETNIKQHICSYRGSAEYIQKRNELSDQRQMLIYIMDKTQTVMWFHFDKEDSIQEENMNFNTNRHVTETNTTMLGDDEKKCLEQLNLTHFFSNLTNLRERIGYADSDDQMNSEIDKKCDRMVCIDGIPECLLYDEESLIKLINLTWRSKTDHKSIAFNNEYNKTHPTLYTLISKMWCAKSFVMMKEYEHVSDLYDNDYIENVFLENIRSKN